MVVQNISLRSFICTPHSRHAINIERCGQYLKNMLTNKELFAEKISKLSDQKLRELLKLTQKENRDIVALAIDEAQRRKIDIGEIRTTIREEDNTQAVDKRKLDKWNWSPLLFGPGWTVANKLDKWTVFYFIPPINLIIAIYLGFNGNRIAFEKSTIGSIDDFMVVQEKWSTWSVRLILITIGLALTFLTMNIVTS